MPLNERQFQERLRAIFDAEAAEHLRALTDGFFALAQTPAGSVADDVIETLFREAHTLKGGARLVGEREAERICQDLESLFFDLKSARATLSGERIEELRDKLNRLRAALHSVASATNTEPSHNPAATTAELNNLSDSIRPEERNAETVAPDVRNSPMPQVRVPADRLDALLVQTEEMLATKRAFLEHFEALRRLQQTADGWQKQWDKLRPRLRSLRLGERPAGLSSQRQLKSIWQFLEWNQEFFSGLESEIERLTRNFGQEQRWSSTLIDGLLEQTKEVLMLPFSSLTDSFPNFIREYSTSHDKGIELRVEGGETQIDRRVLDDVRDAILHLVRNAIDHGIESAEVRLAQGKPTDGILTISVTPRSGSTVEITVRDDGAGLDVREIRETAIRQKLLAPGEERSDSELLSLLFRSGFSTRNTVTELSGRGLGLAIVEEKVERLGGNVSIETARGKGTAFHLLLPITMARFRGIFLKAANQTFVVSAAFVEEIVRVKVELVRAIKNQPTIQFHGEPILLWSLADALGLAPTAPSGESKSIFAVVIRSGQTAVGIAVDDAPYESEVIMKDLGGLLPRVRNIAGATTVGSGTVVPVLNASDLIRSVHRRRMARSAVVSKATSSQAEVAKRILIAEDSITSRTLLKNVLEGAGFAVRTAFDGIEAMTLLKSEPIDLVVSDVQMPRMDGIELTKKIRADPVLSTLPVILVTSLAGREDKERGVEAGANAYIVKSSFDQSDLLKTLERLIG